MRRFLLLFFIFTSIISLKAQDIDVRLFSNKTVSGFALKKYYGDYNVIDKDSNSLATLSETYTVVLKIEDNKIALYNNQVLVALYDTLYLNGTNPKNAFRIWLRTPNEKDAHIYDGDLIASVKNNQILIVNRLDIEDYLAGVMQAEAGGSTNNLEYFKVQAIISRTYAFSNMKKHKSEGYNVCDAVHCQAYHGKCTKSIIIQAATETKGEVVVDSNMNLINAVFHANSGGQTANSQDVWSSYLSYLQSVHDEHSTTQLSSRWKKTISKEKWVNGLIELGYPSDSASIEEAMIFDYGEERPAYFYHDIKLSKIRSKFGLKSAWFSLYEEDGQIYLLGKGYGHGVGLSQQGAIKMAHDGKSCYDIITFYYPLVQIVGFEELKIKD